MNDLASATTGKVIIPAPLVVLAHEGGVRRSRPQQTGDYTNGASLSFWLKLSDPSRPVSNLVFWEKGGGVSYRSHGNPLVFGSTVEPFARNLEGIFEAEEAKFKGPTRTGANDGFLGSGYLDFGSKRGNTSSGA